MTPRYSEPDVNVSNDMKAQQFIYKSNDIAEPDAWNDKATQNSNDNKVEDPTAVRQCVDNGG
jgi:hypothetical protein